MRATEFLTEGATDILYHYTAIESALKILTNGEFELSSVTAIRLKNNMLHQGILTFYLPPAVVWAIIIDGLALVL